MEQSHRQPNVLLILTDDLCYGDLACHGNPYVATPELDRLHRESVRMTRYCSGPLCTPARASLFTGRYPQRTRAIDTYCGRSILDPDERTIPEMLRARGYRTGLFGKWHLGDTYPSRPMDKGFDESVVHLGGGLRQPANIGYDGYFNPDLMHNGQLKNYSGYCTDIFAQAAMDWMRNGEAGEPFFCVLSTNAPHSPFEIGPEWWEKYKRPDLPETWSRLYGMVENLDWNIGRVRESIEGEGLRENTLVIFLSDHGPCPSADADGKIRFNCGLRERKGTPYEGGLRVPCFWSLPGLVDGGRDIDRVSHPIDILPTLADLCGASPPADRTIDGRSLKPLLTGEQDGPECWPDRKLFVQWHRGNEPIRYKNYAVITQNEKLCRAEGGNRDELYKLEDDPQERRDLAGDYPDRVEALRAAYDEWFDDVGSERADNYAPLPARIGGEPENPVVLSRNDWRIKGPEEQYNLPEHDGYWPIEVLEEGVYDVTVYPPPAEADGVVRLKIGTQAWSERIEAGAEACRFEGLNLPSGLSRVDAQLTVGGKVFGASLVRLCNRAHPALVDASVSIKNGFGEARSR